MNTTAISWMMINGDIVNIFQISHVSPCVLGKECDAGFDQQKDKFVIIGLSSGRTYRLHHSNPNTKEVLKELNLNFDKNGMT